MSSINDFRKKLDSDQEFAEKIKGCRGAEEIIAAAKAVGITLTNADLVKDLASAKGDNEMSDKELESIHSDTVLAAALIK